MKSKHRDDLINRGPLGKSHPPEYLVPPRIQSAVSNKYTQCEGTHVVTISSPSERDIDFGEFLLDDIVRHREVTPVKLLLTVNEASLVLSISRSKFYGLLNSGHLPSVHIGRSRRIRMRDLEEFVTGGGREY